MMVLRQSSQLPRAVHKYCPHVLFPLVIVRQNQDLIWVKRKAALSPIPSAVAEKWLLKLHSAWANSCSQLPSENWSFLYLSTETEQCKSNYHSGKSYFHVVGVFVCLVVFFCYLFFPYIVINSMTRWWDLVPRPQAPPSEELKFPAHSFLRATAKKRNSCGHNVMFPPTLHWLT